MRFRDSIRAGRLTPAPRRYFPPSIGVVDVFRGLSPWTRGLHWPITGTPFGRPIADEGMKRLPGDPDPGASYWFDASAKPIG